MGHLSPVQERRQFSNHLSANLLVSCHLHSHRMLVFAYLIASTVTWPSVSSADEICDLLYAQANGTRADLH